MDQDYKSLLERLEKVERNQAHLLTVLKDKDAKSRMAIALGSADLGTVKALIELGLHGIDEPVNGRTPLNIALDKQGQSHIKPECLPEIAHYLLDAGADPLALEHDVYHSARKTLVSMVDPESEDRLQLLMRCAKRINESDSQEARGVEGLIATRAVMADRCDLLTPEILAADLNAMHLKISNAGSDRCQELDGITLHGRSYGVMLWAQPLNYLAIFGSDEQFGRGLELGLQTAESSVYFEGSGKTHAPVSTVEILEGLKKTDRVTMLRSAAARAEAINVIEKIGNAKRQQAPSP